jgi:hypothetical protein
LQTLLSLWGLILDLPQPASELPQLPWLFWWLDYHHHLESGRSLAVDMMSVRGRYVDWIYLHVSNGLLPIYNVVTNSIC